MWLFVCVCACTRGLQVWAQLKEASSAAATGPRYVEPRVGALTPRSFTEVRGCVVLSGREGGLCAPPFSMMHR